MFPSRMHLILWSCGLLLLVARQTTAATGTGISNKISDDNHQPRNLQPLKAGNPSVGSFKVLVVLVQFSDHQDDGRTLIDKSVIETTFSTTIKDWFSANSQGVYEITPVVADWVVTDNTEAFYSFGKSGFDRGLQKAMWPALDALDADPSWNWTDFDVNNDGDLDAVVMMHSGFDSLAGGQDCYNQQESTNRINAHAYMSCATDCWQSANGSVSVNGFAIGSVYAGNCDDQGPFQPGLLTHEYLHTFGLVDLYDGENLFEARGCGAWDIMSHPYGPDNSGIPSFLSVWSRNAANWLPNGFQTIETDGTYTLQPAQTSQASYQIFLSDITERAEYLLLENRQQIGFDANLWDSGLVIYHVDDAADGMKNRGFPGQSGWPQNGNHYQVAVLPKDGNYDLEQNVNYGDGGDMWLPGDTLQPGQGNTVFPNTDRYQRGNIRETGITITILAQEANGDVTFEVTGLTAYYADNDITPGGTDAATTFDDFADQAANGGNTGGDSTTFSDKSAAIHSLCSMSSLIWGASILFSLCFA